MEIPIEVLLNCIIVKNGGREAMLIEPSAYQEKNESSHTTKEILKNIKKQYPTLIQTPDKNSGRIFISRKKLSDDDFDTDEKTGNLLGFPCAKEFHTLDRDKKTYSYNIVVILKNGSNINIITDACQHKSYEKHELLLKSIKNALKQDEIWHTIQDVIINELEHIPIMELIQPIMKGHLTEQEIWTLKNHLWNLFSGSETVSNYNFQYKNPIHKGILISLVIYSKNNPMEPFYPLQLTDRDNEVHTITREWERDLIKALDASKNSSGGTRKRKNNLNL